MLSQRGPVIIVGADLMLLAHGTKTRAGFIPQNYTSEKTIAHLALGTIALLQAFASDPLSSEAKWRPHLEKLKASAAALRPIFDTLGLDHDALARAEFIFDRTGVFIDDALTHGTYTRDDLQKMARDLAPILLASANSAARAQLALLHSVVQGWRGRMTEAEWKSVRVFVLAPGCLVRTTSPSRIFASLWARRQ